MATTQETQYATEGLKKLGYNSPDSLEISSYLKENPMDFSKAVSATNLNTPTVNIPAKPEGVDTTGLTAPLTPVAPSPVPPPPSATELYTNLSNNSGVYQAEQGLSQNQLAENNATQEFNIINADIQSIADRAKAQSLAQEKRGRMGETLGAISGTQRDIQRQAAVESLPLQAKALAAQAKVLFAQNNTAAAQTALQNAQKKLETLFTIQSKDLENQYNYKLKIQEQAREDMNATEKAQLDKIQEADKQAFELKKMETAQKYDKELLKYKQGLGGTTTTTEAPVVKTINGVDKQWNSNTQTWEDIGAVSNVDNTQKSLDQFKFLRDTIASAQNLAGAAGPSGITKLAGDIFVGNTKVKQLAQKLDTLKVNLLTLNTDPSIKKFFGPQMTERDTQLMTSAGTTMDAYNNSEKDLKAELTRYDDLINRMQTAVKSNGVPSGTTITAPDGRIIQITD